MKSAALRALPAASPTEAIIAARFMRSRRISLPPSSATAMTPGVVTLCLYLGRRGHLPCRFQAQRLLLQQLGSRARPEQNERSKDEAAGDSVAYRYPLSIFEVATAGKRRLRESGAQGNRCGLGSESRFRGCQEIGVYAGRTFISSFSRKREPRDFARLPWAPLLRGDGSIARAIGLHSLSRE